MNAPASTVSSFRRPAMTLLLALIGAAALAWLFRDGLSEMAKVWFTTEEFSHGVLIPAIALFLAWQKRYVLRQIELRPSWLGAVVVAVALLLNLLGQLASVFVLQQYAFVLAIYGLVAAFAGLAALRVLWAPLLVLLFMVPLPNFLLNNFSANLQLISSEIGVWFIRLFGISVFVEGNVIDLGVYKLQVAEACDGLRYLFPLMTLGFIMAYMFKVSMWKRVLLFLSTIPVTILMNSFRIGTIGVMVEYWGIGMAEGFLHDFQGWAVFMTSAALLLAEMMVLARIGRNGRPWREVFGLDAEAAPDTARRTGALAAAAGMAPAPFIASTVILAGFVVGVVLIPERVEAVPQRESFFSFPTKVETWDGRRDVMEQIYLDVLKLDDYVMADYFRGDKELVNFYVAWYDSQRAGQSAHSPRSCLPGGGWRISELTQVEIPGVQVGNALLRANRVQIELGNQRQLVYYWFQQRGRVITNEYLVKWYLFWDSLTRQRTDGALVRLVTPLQIGESSQVADQRLAEFAGDVASKLQRYIPD